MKQATGESPPLRRYIPRVRVPWAKQNVGRTQAPGERRRELLTFWLYRVGERIINALPRGLVMPAAAAVGNVAYDLGGPKRALIHDNLARPMGLPADDRRVKRAARRAFRNYAKYLADMMRIGEMTPAQAADLVGIENVEDRKSTRLNSSHSQISYAVFCLK